jgi:NAD-dependent SIR2 family protein deacetylase
MTVEKDMMSEDLPELIEAINNESLIIFVGAGISQNSGMPGWGELIEPLKKELIELNLDPLENNYLKIAQYYYDNFGAERYKIKIKKILGNFENYQPNALHDLIEAIDPIHIITTNYDNLLEKHLNSEQEKYSVIAADADIPNTNRNHRIIKMHGDFFHDNIVLKEDDYESYSDNFPMISDIIKSYLMDYTVLFIGYGLNDSTFKALLNTMLKNFGANARKHYYFIASTPREVDIKYYKKKGIEILTGNLEIPKNATSEDKTKMYGDATANFLSKIIEDKSNTEQIPDLPFNKSKDVNSSDDIWDNIGFLNALNYVESQDVFRYANISSRAILYPNNRVIYRDNREDKYNIIENESLVKFLKSKTSIENFLDFEISQNNDIEINTELEKAFELYKQRRYTEAYSEFDKIASSAFESRDYWNYFIAEFNLNHIVLPYRNKESNTERKNVEQVINDVISNGTLNDKRLATYFKEEILSFRFIYKKLFRINDLL